jgi:hypothetical protein
MTSHEKHHHRGHGEDDEPPSPQPPCQEEDTESHEHGWGVAESVGQSARAFAQRVARRPVAVSSRRNEWFSALDRVKVVRLELSDVVYASSTLSHLQRALETRLGAEILAFGTPQAEFTGDMTRPLSESGVSRDVSLVVALAPEEPTPRQPPVPEPELSDVPSLTKSTSSPDLLRTDQHPEKAALRQRSRSLQTASLLRRVPPPTKPATPPKPKTYTLVVARPPEPPPISPVSPIAARPERHSRNRKLFTTLAKPEHSETRRAISRILFIAMDTNKSGTIEPLELRSYCERVASRVAHRKRSSPASAKRSSAFFMEQSDDSEDDGGDLLDTFDVKLQRLPLRLEAAFCSVLGGTELSRLRESFRRHDANGDGRLQIDEFVRMADKALLAAAWQNVPAASATGDD